MILVSGHFRLPPERIAEARAEMVRVIEASLQPYDYCAVIPEIEGAGGVMTDWQGKALSIESDGRVRLLGRAPGATPRGCSLAIEEALGSER